MTTETINIVNNFPGGKRQALRWQMCIKCPSELAQFSPGPEIPGARPNSPQYVGHWAEIQHWALARKLGLGYFLNKHIEFCTHKGSISVYNLR